MSDWGPSYFGGEDSIDRTYEERWAGDAHLGRPRERPPRRPRRRGIPVLPVLRGLLTLVTVLAVAVVATGAGLALYTSAQITREPVDGLQTSGPGLNVLVVGSDSREGFTPEELQALGTEVVQGRRTDTIFLLSIQGGRAAMLSFPRDLYVTLCDGTQGRLNAAYSRGGPSCLVQTVTQTSGIPIDHYLEVNLFGFVQIVDAVGGVTIFLEEPLVDPAAGVALEAGCHHLDGRQAIGFVRSRSQDTDLGRIARQQRFIKELAEEVVASDTLTNVPRLFRVAGAGGRSLTADQGLDVLDMLRVARAGRGLAGGGLATFTVPAGAANIEGAAVLVPSGEAELLFAQFVDGSILQLPVEEGVQALRPDDVPLAVLNGTGREGLAAQVRDVLTAHGFEITAIGNAPPTDRTVVRHPPSQQAGAQLVADAVGGAPLEEDATASGIVLVLGSRVDLSAPPPPPMEDPDPAEDVPLGASPVPEGCA